MSLLLLFQSDIWQLLFAVLPSGRRHVMCNVHMHVLELMWIVPLLGYWYTDTPRLRGRFTSDVKLGRQPLQRLIKINCTTTYHQPVEVYQCIEQRSRTGLVQDWGLYVSLEGTALTPWVGYAPSNGRSATLLSTSLCVQPSSPHV